jgi:hypothetical protein
MAEVIELLRAVKPLAAGESEEWGKLLGVPMEKKKRGWF